MTCDRDIIGNLPVIRPCADDVIGNIIRRRETGLSWILNGFPTWYAAYTRAGDATAEDASGTPVTVPYDVPPYEYADGQKLYRQSYSTDNPGTLPLLAEDIDTAAYRFNGTSDYINGIVLTLNENADFHISITIRTNVSEKTIWALSTDSLDDRLSLGVESNVLKISSNNHTPGNGSIVVADNQPHIIDVFYTASDNTLSTYVDNVFDYSVTHQKPSVLTTSFDLLIGAYRSNEAAVISEFFSGSIWGASAISNDVLLFSSPFSQYRRDTFIPDLFGNGNHGESARPVNEMIVENAGYGYPVNLEARRPFTTTDGDGNIVRYGVKGCLNGVADGAELVVNGNFETDSEWTKDTGWSITGGQAVSDGTIGNIRQDGVYSIGDLVETKFIISESAIVNSLSVRVGNTGSNDYSADRTGEHVFRTIADGTSLLFRVGSTNSFVGGVDMVSSRVISPATFSLKIENHTIDDLSSNVTLLEASDGTDIVYVDSADGLIKMTDGTNTVTSDTAVVAGTPFDALLVGNQTEMWITKDGSKGTIGTFVGYMPALGNRVFAIVSDVYQTNETFGISNELEFDYVYHNGVLVTHNGEPVIVYR